MNAVQRRIVLGAGAALALAMNAAIAQDAKEPYQEPATQKAQPAQKAKTAPVDQTSMPTSQEPASTRPLTEATKSTETKATPTARTELNRTSVQNLAKLEDFDKNKDGSLSKEEAPANDALGMNFASYDKDGDGKISQQEFAQYKNGNRQLASSKQAKPKAKQEKPEQQ